MLFFLEIIQLAINYNIAPICYLKNKTGDIEYLAIGASKYLRILNQSTQVYTVTLYLVPLNSILNRKNNCFFFLPLILLKRESKNFSFLLNNPINLGLEYKEDNKEGSKLNTELPSKADWKIAFEQAIKDFDDVNDKVVLSKIKSVSVDTRTNDIKILENLAEKSKDSYLFYLKTESEKSYFSISPETLYKKIHERYEIDAIAGTRSYNSIEDLDSKKHELSTSNKDIGEHETVCRYIESVLLDAGIDIKRISERQILTLDNLIHLHSKYQFSSEHINFKQLINLIHPTPAVCGKNREKSLKTIEKLEPFKREYFAGGAGIIGKDYQDILVNIRSGEKVYNLMNIFAGAGIVKDSDPDLEWQEISSKMDNFSFLWKEDGSI